MLKKNKDQKPTKRDAEHYIVVNNAPISLLREKRRGGAIVMEFEHDSDFAQALIQEGAMDDKTIFRFWGWDVVIAVVDLIIEWRREQQE